ncbi:MAG: hypothetical protein FH762_01430 [Firmicutes bacterium]|nr:hypothetical protein [Bacillota bacterium]
MTAEHIAANGLILIIYAGKVKPAPAYDWMDLSSSENSLFGTANVDSQHFSEYSYQNSEVAGSLAAAKVVKMMNPIYYIGTDGSTTASFWRLRIGSKDIMVVNNLILTAKLRNEVANVDSALAWDVGHAGDYDLDELFTWMKSVCH